MKKKELEEELGGRGIYEGSTKPELQNLLDEDLHGVSHVPALLFTNPNKTLETLNLGSYDVLPCEPMHDIAHHIENLLTELPAHIEEKFQKKLLEAVDLTIGMLTNNNFKLCEGNCKRRSAKSTEHSS